MDMASRLADFARDYECALAAYLDAGEDEAALLHAYEFGRRAISEKHSLLDLIALHHQAVRNVALASGALREAAVKMVEDFLTQALAPFEMSHRQALERSQALRDSERRKAAILENAFDAIITMNHAGRIIEFNPAAERMFGHTRAQALGAELAALIIPPRLRQAHRDGLARYLKSGEGAIFGRRVEMPAMRAGGAEFPAEVAVSAMNIDGQAFFSAHVLDITERKAAKEQARRFNAELEQRVEERTAELSAANRELDSFTYSVSHDLRAPLRAVDGLSRALIDGYGALLPPDALRYLSLVRGNAQQMGRLVNDLLELSRFGRKPINKSEVDVGRLVAECLDALRPEYEDRAVEFDIGELGTCEADGDLLRQVLMNLLSNALKYSRRRRPARIEARAQRLGGEYLLSVRDNGAGFDMRYAGKLFGVFQRLHRAEEYEGTGVGLTIVKRIVERHGGRVWAEAKPDEGAAFFVALPSASYTA